MASPFAVATSERKKYSQEGSQIFKLLFSVYGGEGEIRTPDSLTTMPDFESGAFNRALPPLRVFTYPGLYESNGKDVFDATLRSAHWAAFAFHPVLMRLHTQASQNQPHPGSNDPCIFPHEHGTASRHYDGLDL